jgi:hypothetical protein
MTVWPSFRQAWAVDTAADIVLLGDLSAYVSLSGRLRLTEHVVLLGGAPGVRGGRDAGRKGGADIPATRG